MPKTLRRREIYNVLTLSSAARNPTPQDLPIHRSIVSSAATPAKNWSSTLTTWRAGPCGSGLR